MCISSGISVYYSNAVTGKAQVNGEIQYVSIRFSPSDS